MTRLGREAATNRCTIALYRRRVEIFHVDLARQRAGGDLSRRPGLPPYHSEPVVRDEHLLEVGRYIALNPVRAGLCTDPCEWPWSTYNRSWPFVDPSTLHGAFGSALEFQEFVADGTERLQLVETRLQML